MLGAIAGDIVGSRFEFNNRRSKDFELFAADCRVTDDSIMTLAVAAALLEATEAARLHDDVFVAQVTVRYMREIGRKYPDCGYGGRFREWVFGEDPKPYYSFGNGAAMRISPVAYVSGTEQEVIRLSKAVTGVTHNHPEGIKGAEAVAIAVFMARQGRTREEIRDRINRDYYPLNFTIDEIRDTYRFNETCQETVPQAIVAFLESVSFEDALRTAVSVGGDSDTLAAITGSIAEAYYGIPEEIKDKALSYLDDELKVIYDRWVLSVGVSGGA